MCQIRPAAPRRMRRDMLQGPRRRRPETGHHLKHMTKPVVTRFAPSPTGYLHIGGARTALFNWLYAKHTGGKFLLRIEDTDRERSTESAIQAILDGLTWLQLDWDGEPLYQFARADRHREVALKLLADGRAYHCYLTPEELEAMHKAIMDERELAKQEKRTPRGPQSIQSPWRDRDPAEAPAGVKPVIRLRVPREGEAVIDDQVQGRVVIPNTQLDDMIILRSDGTPVYNHAVVVDDHDMGVTHVIRGVDHLTNAARQVQIYKAMGWDLPVFAHVPLIHGPDGAKLSKRHGALGIEAYRQMGFLPAGLRNYLVRLGWSHGDDEIFSRVQFLEWFDLDHLGRSAAQFDEAKLRWVNAQHLKAMDDDALAPLVAEQLQKRGIAADERLPAICGLFKDRCDTTVALADWAQAYYADVTPSADDLAKHVTDAVKPAVAALRDRLAAADWTTPAITAAIKDTLAEHGLKMPQLAMPVRVLVMGTPQTPSVDAMLALHRREIVLSRLQNV